MTFAREQKKKTRQTSSSDFQVRRRHKWDDIERDRLAPCVCHRIVSRNRTRYAFVRIRARVCGGEGRERGKGEPLFATKSLQKILRIFIYVTDRGSNRNDRNRTRDSRTTKNLSDCENIFRATREQWRHVSQESRTWPRGKGNSS